MRSVGLAVGLVAVCLSGSAWAQLRQPRCGGYPPAQGRAGLIIGGEDSTCYGFLANRVKARSAIAGSRVLSPPAHGTFRLLSEREFEYTPRRGMTAPDRVIVAFGRSRDGQTTETQMTLMATTETLYRASGGSESGPSSDAEVGRDTHLGKGGRRGRGAF